ncbi:acyl-ACP--UDP-N-acetylglucosamine O-acyltransferase [Legionella taurinensis]|uniref:Acyl-ACP--UDP-N-acetylglucosamine O-acyltransferase n=1 Tax=Legionella taurinensis TaxID=70611 RepID=A0A3A5L7H8_9GAMM|nr:acyl-ACP--UDP-N-acetylglucosamine O-acyltransferase [Legionella taurinensis]MDX1836466.1 acyl-ACP--UDP-N-acetylglucosamine O-acyltransferase [Legionella taurinensis]PUT43062.1 acyl-[acyl-carrier-protein]--UDP-N-acetylglucosamine O-acyltransferase [Legionella taurinensis]PUT45120.1 acyl-[acyl-carrier-protein]--UDP-N-acetylglucosamine O-acyltransferase [Legionella taurinensis]PUT45617.1 acyl-[acyl-carrier-protein]--UDP-N-acetylglucosamine O-acyltransferase [Legionella taurinensis]PUT49386.1 a
MSTVIHPSAIVDEKAILGQHVSIGPYSIIGPDVTLGDHVHIDSHVVIKGHTQIGSHTCVHPFACLGDVPQVRNYTEEDSLLVIGEHNYIGQYVTINGGTSKDQGVTRIGDHNMFMACAHIAHDCQIGNHVTLANAVLLAGHVHIDDYAVLGGASVVAQYVHIGKAAMMSGASSIANDLIPYGYAEGFRAALDSINIIGMKRLGIDRSEIHAMLYFFKTVFFRKHDNHESFLDRLERYKTEDAIHWDSIMEVLRFIEHRSKKSLCMPSGSAH